MDILLIFQRKELGGGEMKKYELYLYIDGKKELYISTQDPIDIVEMIDHWGNFPRFLKKKKEDKKLPKHYY